MAACSLEVRVSTIARWISGMAIPTALTTRVPPTARITLRGYRQQYPASRATQPRSRGPACAAPAGPRACSVVVFWSVLSRVSLFVAASFPPAGQAGSTPNEWQHPPGRRHFRPTGRRRGRAGRGQARAGAFPVP